MRRRTRQAIDYFVPRTVLSGDVDCAQRNPMVADRWSGPEPLRVAVRSMIGLLFHEPPRTLL